MQQTIKHSLHLLQYVFIFSQLTNIEKCIQMYMVIHILDQGLISEITIPIFL